MLKKIILLLLISLCCQINLFSMNAFEEMVNVEENIQQCTQCGEDKFSEYKAYCALIYECSNCKQKYRLSKPHKCQQFEAEIFSKQSGDSLDNNDSKKDDNCFEIKEKNRNMGLIKPKLEKEIKFNILNKLVKYSAITTVLYLMWKYRTQIKRFLVRK